LADGTFQRAATELKGALDAADQLPVRLTCGPTAANWSTSSGRRAGCRGFASANRWPRWCGTRSVLPEAEWQAVFAHRYSGRSVILDETVHRDAAGQYHGAYRIQVTGADSRI